MDTKEREDICINYGGGVNSTAILSLMCQGKLKYKNPLILFADTGAEKPETYAYLDYIQNEIKAHGYEITIVKSKEGSLLDYCKTNKILPMRHLRWCTDRWKRKPMEDYRKGRDYKLIVGIDYGERQRAYRWKNDGSTLFPLISLQYTRQDCIKEIEKIGWKVPVKSGCYFCPYAFKEFRELKINHPDLFKEVCALESQTLERLSDMKAKGWYVESMPLDKAVEKRYPETCEGQETLCCYCMS